MTHPDLKIQDEPKPEMPLGLGTCDDCGEFRGLTQWRDVYLCDDCLKFRIDG